MTEIDGIKVKEILKFPPAPGFGRFKTFFDGSSVAHPAKMHVELCAELIRRYTKPGDVVLDPMNGVGTTTILCVLLGRNAIGVELEEKFHNWCEISRKITEEKIRGFLGALKKRPPVTGWCECNPTEDSYEPAMDVKNPDEVIEKFPIKIETCEKCGKPIYPRFGKVVHICGDARKLSTILKEHEEEVRCVLFSPPYSLGHDSGDNASEKYRWRLDEQRKHTRAYSEGNNIAKLPHGEVDSVIFSPPFGQVQKGGGIAQKGYDDQYGRDERLHLRHDRPLSERDDNISNLPYGVNCVITSPPYVDSMGDKHHSPRGDEIVREKRHYNTYTEAKKKDNIGNLRKETYLSAMVTVYEQCHLVLKQGGKMIVIVKPFVRNFKVVKLHEHTIKLCELAGFVLKEVLLFKLPQQSFWRILYKKKHGSKVKNLDLLDYEWVLVFEKPKNNQAP